MKKILLDYKTIKSYAKTPTRLNIQVTRPSARYSLKVTLYKIKMKVKMFPALQYFLTSVQGFLPVKIY